MNKLILRFYYLKKQETIEAEFDDRLSFRANFALLNKLRPIDYSYIYDPTHRIFLRQDLPLQNFHFRPLMTFFLY